MNNDTLENMIIFLKSAGIPVDNLKYLSEEDYFSVIFPFFFFLGVFEMITVTNIIIHFYCSFNDIFSIKPSNQLTSNKKLLLNYW